MNDEDYLRSSISVDSLTFSKIDDLAARHTTILRPRVPKSPWVIMDKFEGNGIPGPVILLSPFPSPFDSKDAMHGVLHVHYDVPCSSYAHAKRTPEDEAVEDLINQEARRLIEEKPDVVSYALQTLGRPSLLRSLEPDPPPRRSLLSYFGC